MPWLGEEYFPAYPGEADWQLPDGRMVGREYALRDADHLRCPVRCGPEVCFCLRHWIALWRHKD
jgi:hypothetical protein